jgi:hypothetical protein
MTTLQQAEDVLAQLTRSEKAQLLQSLAGELGDAFPGIESAPGVCGGEPCVVRTRITVWLLEQAVPDNEVQSLVNEATER